MSHQITNLALTPRETATLRAALVHYQEQGFGDMHKLPPQLARIAADGATGLVPLDDAEIRDLLHHLTPTPAADAPSRWHVEHEFDDEPDADCFRAGDVWQTSRGTLYHVIQSRRGGKAVLRVGKDGSGRKVVRDWDAVIGWFRVECGPAS